VLRFKDSKDKLIRRAVVGLLPSMAAFAPERFAQGELLDSHPMGAGMATGGCYLGLQQAAAAKSAACGRGLHWATCWAWPADYMACTGPRVVPALPCRLPGQVHQPPHQHAEDATGAGLGIFSAGRCAQRQPLPEAATFTPWLVQTRTRAASPGMCRSPVTDQQTCGDPTAPVPGWLQRWQPAWRLSSALMASTPTCTPLPSR